MKYQDQGYLSPPSASSADAKTDLPLLGTDALAAVLTDEIAQTEALIEKSVAVERSVEADLEASSQAVAR